MIYAFTCEAYVVTSRVCVCARVCMCILSPRACSVCVTPCVGMNVPAVCVSVTTLVSEVLSQAELELQDRGSPGSQDGTW